MTSEAPLRVVTATTEYTDGLRELADFIDAHPEFVGNLAGVTVYDFVQHLKPDDIAEAFRERAEALTDPAIDSGGNYFNATQFFGPHKFQVTIPKAALVPDLPEVRHPLA